MKRNMTHETADIVQKFEKEKAAVKHLKDIFIGETQSTSCQTNTDVDIPYRVT